MHLILEDKIVPPNSHIMTMAQFQKKIVDPLIEITSGSGKTLSPFPEFSLSELWSYLSWDCPLNDTSLIALIARLIMEYVGKNATISILKKCKNGYFLFDSGCASNDGMFYCVHSKRNTTGKKIY